MAGRDGPPAELRPQHARRAGRGPRRDGRRAVDHHPPRDRRPSRWSRKSLGLTVEPGKVIGFTDVDTVATDAGDHAHLRDDRPPVHGGRGRHQRLDGHRRARAPSLEPRRADRDDHGHAAGQPDPRRDQRAARASSRWRSCRARATGPTRSAPTCATAAPLEAPAPAQRAARQSSGHQPRRSQPGQRAVDRRDRSAVVLGALLAGDRVAHHVAADEASRLRRHARAAAARTSPHRDHSSSRPERQRGEDPPAEHRRTDAVARVARAADRSGRPSVVKNGSPSSVRSIGPVQLAAIGTVGQERVQQPHPRGELGARSASGP